MYLKFFEKQKGYSLNLHQNYYFWTKKIFTNMLGIIFLSACTSAPTRSDNEAFVVLKEGRVEGSSVKAFSDCLLDGFDKAHFMISNVISRQQRRSDSYRLETLAAGRILLISADAFDDGRVVLSESQSASLINTSGERDTFEKCLLKYAKK